VFYDPGRAVGSCGLGPFPSGGWYASLPLDGYAGGAACGSYLDVRGPAGQVRAEVVDVCTTCAPWTVDLSRAAFARIADLRSGAAAVTAAAVTDPPLPGPLVLRLDTGVPGRLAVQVLNHGNRLASVEIYQAWGGHWQRLAVDPDGYWSGRLAARPHPLRGRIRVRVADAAGHRVLVNGVALTATAVRTSTWMYRAARPAVHRSRPPWAAVTRAARGGPGCPG